jgi:hypothetical protein
MPFLAFGLVARIAAPRLADWELANLVAQPPAKVAQPPAEISLCRYGLSLLPRNFLRAVLVRTAFELSSGLNVGGELTGGELTDWLPTSLTGWTLNMVFISWSRGSSSMGGCGAGLR